MNDVSNKASICAIVHLEIIDFQKKADSERAQIKNELNHLINRAVIDIAHNNRAILNVADGAVIACIGVLTDALEDALLISLTIRDEILENNSLNSTPFYLRFGINLGAAKLFSSMNAKPSIVDESIEEAHRMMSFAKPNQILVSSAYYEMASKLSQEISQMFEYHDMHASEQEIYAVRMHKEFAVIEELPSISPDIAIPHISPPINPVPDNLAPDNLVPENRQAIISKINWNYVSLSLMVLIAFFVMAKLVSTPTAPAISVAKPAIKAPTIKVVQPALKEPSPKTVANLPAKTADNFLLPNESVEKSPPEVNSNALAEQKIVQEEIEQKTIQEKVEQKVEQKIVQKKVKKNIAQKKARPKIAAEIKAETKTETKAETKAEAPTNTAAKPVASKVEKGTEKDKSGWETFKNSVKQGTDRKCTQAEIALNQCR